MPISPGDIWNRLPPVMKQQIRKDITVVLKEILGSSGGSARWAWKKWTH
jgi:hypothetical protein